MSTTASFAGIFRNIRHTPFTSIFNSLTSNRTYKTWTVLVYRHTQHIRYHLQCEWSRASVTLWKAKLSKCVICWCRWVPIGVCTPHGCHWYVIESINRSNTHRARILQRYIADLSCDVKHYIGIVIGVVKYISHGISTPHVWHYNEYQTDRQIPTRATRSRKIILISCMAWIKIFSGPFFGIRDYYFNCKIRRQDEEKQIFFFHFTVF